MPEEDRYEIHLEGHAKDAITQIADVLRGFRGGKEVTYEEALQRALGTELYLLQKVKEGAKIAVEPRGGGRIELDLSE